MFGHLGSYSSNYPSETPSSASAPSFIDVNGSLVAIESLFYHVSPSLVIFHSSKPVSLSFTVFLTATPLIGADSSPCSLFLLIYFLFSYLYLFNYCFLVISFDK